MSEYEGEHEQFKTDRAETHPNPEGNGDATLDFFRDQFDFSARETAAIMGAHTIGRMTMAHSLFKECITTYSSCKSFTLRPLFKMKKSKIAEALSNTL